VSGCFGLVNFGSVIGKLGPAVAHEIAAEHDLAANPLISLAKSLVKNPHHKLPYPGLVARPWPATLRIFTRCSSVKAFSLSAAALSAAQRCSRGFLCFRAKSTVFNDPPVNVDSIENKTVASLSRTFHSVL
jgi:hypothetical protein